MPVAQPQTRKRSKSTTRQRGDEKSDSPEAKRPTKPTGDDINFCVQNVLAAAHSATIQFNSQSNQLAFLSQLGFDLSDYKKACEIYLQDKVDNYTYHNAKDTVDRHVNLSHILASLPEHKKFITWTTSDTDGNNSREWTTPLEKSALTGNHMAVEYNIICEKIYSDSARKMLVTAMSLFNPQTDNTSVYCFDTMWLNDKSTKIKLISSGQLDSLKKAQSLKDELEKVVTSLKLDISHQIMENQKLFNDHIQNLEKRMEKKFEEKFSSMVKDLKTKSKESKSTKEVTIQSPEKKKEKETKSNRGWEKVPSRSRSRGRSMTRRSGPKRFIIRPPTPTKENKGKIDTEFIKKKSLAMILTVKQNVKLEKVKTWFNATKEETPLLGFDKKKVTFDNMTDSKQGNKRFKVMIKDLPIQNKSIEDIWRSFNIPFGVAITEWKGDVTKSTVPTTKRRGWLVSNLNPDRCFKEKLINKVKEVYTDEDETATAVKLPPPAFLKGEKPRYASYCVVVHKKVLENMETEEEGDDAFKLIDDLFTDHMKTTCPSVRIAEWRGRLKFSDGPMSKEPVDDF